MSSLTCIRPSQLPSSQFDLAIVIDVLRATSTSTTLVDCGFPEVFAVPTLSEIRALPQRARWLLVSELPDAGAYGERIDNSPHLARRLTLDAGTPVLVTTNGTQVMALAASHSRRVLLCCFMNVAAVAAMVRTLAPERAVVLPCGDVAAGAPLIEDDACAEALIGLVHGRPVDVSALTAACRADPRIRRRLDRNESFKYDLDLCLQAGVCSTIAEFWMAGDYGIIRAVQQHDPLETP
jgi:phosphosulfolactate phosphohydrolase-like enzyme